MSDRSVPELDRQTVARLAGTAQLHAPGRDPTEAETAAAAAQLREIAGGRGDLLAEAAGLLLGFYWRTVQEPRARAAASYCIAAGADPDLIPRWIQVGLDRAAAARQVPDARPGVSEPVTGLEAGEATTKPGPSRPPRPTDTAGMRLRHALVWRPAAGGNRWRTFRFNMYPVTVGAGHRHRKRRTQRVRLDTVRAGSNPFRVRFVSQSVDRLSGQKFR